MTRVLIPRSDNTSAKIVEASDFEKYHSFLNDHIISGFVVSAGSGLDVDVGTGTGRLQGLYVENTVTCNVSGLTACSTNYLYISIDRDPNCEPEGWSFVTNTTNTTPACSIKIASIVTGVEQQYQVYHKYKIQVMVVGILLIIVGLITSFSMVLVRVEMLLYQHVQFLLGPNIIRI